MTDRLYYEDAFMMEFDAVTEAIEERADGIWICLDRTAFYPTSGGQPHDTGELTIGGKSFGVSDVESDSADDIWHKVEISISVGMAVHGRIDWERRLDHMQQHGGEHMLACSIWEQHRGLTIGLHIGSSVSTIDVTMPDGRTRLLPEEIASLEDEVNKRIRMDVPVLCRFPSREELRTLQMRKVPTVSKNVRIVEYGSYERVACGGTHPSSSGQIGLLKILDVTPARGKARFSFLCGERALRDYRVCAFAVSETASLLSCRVSELPLAVHKLKESAAELREQIAALKCRATLSALPLLLADARLLPGGGRLVLSELEGADIWLLREAASVLIRNPGIIALLFSQQRESCLFIFARSADLLADMSALMRISGVKGGGKPDYAHGSADTSAPIKAAAMHLLGSGR